MQSDEILVLIDQLTKDTVWKASYDAISKKSKVVRDIREISASNNGSTLIVFEPSFLFVITKEIASHLIDRFDIKIIAVYQDEKMHGCLGNEVNYFKCNYGDINWNLIYGLVQSDFAILEPYQNSLEIIDSFSSIRDKVTPDIAEYLTRFRGTYLTLLNAVNSLSEINDKLQTDLDIAEHLSNRSIKGLKEMKHLLDLSMDKIKSYELLLSKTYDECVTTFYPDRPNVLYIKRISHLSGIDLFISVLFSTITTQSKLSCKVVKLLDSSNARTISYVPRTYFPITDTYNTSDILTNEFIMKIGSFKVMFDTLLSNRSGLDILIVHDMRSSIQDALSPDLINLKLNEITSDYLILGEYDNTLSDTGSNVDYEWDYRAIKKYTGSKLSQLVNHPTITKVLDNIIG